MTRIGLIGDLHGDNTWTAFALWRMKQDGIDTILQLGDFGIWPGESGRKFINNTNILLKKYDMTMYVVPGNHEDYDQIDATPIEEDGWQHFTSRILLAPRGHRWEWDNRSFVALGGAPSVDRSWRLGDFAHPSETKSWWPQEAISDEDVQKVIDGGTADVMVAHDCPFIPEVEARIKDNPMGFKQIDLDYAYEGRMKMERAFTAVEPKVFLFGHYHFLTNTTMDVPSAPFTDDVKFTSRMLGLSCNQNNHSLGVLYTEDLSSMAWSIERDFKTFLRTPKKER